MSYLQTLSAIAIVVLSFFSWSDGETKESKKSVPHYCTITAMFDGRYPIFSCSNQTYHDYSNDKYGTGTKKWWPISLAAIVLLSLILSIIFDDLEFVLSMAILLLVLGILSYCIYYFFAYDGLSIMFWIIPCASAVGLYDAVSEIDK